MKQARAKAKASSKFAAADAAVYATVAEKVGAIDFVGYESMVDVKSSLKAIIADGREVDSLKSGEEGEIVISPTPFYAESGGQVGDPGTLEWKGGRAEVLDTQRQVGDLIVSRVKVIEGTLTKGAEVTAALKVPVRLDTTANHTATHLLHKALKDMLGETVQQAGSLVAPDRLRFDYTYHQPLTPEQLEQLETMVNDKIRENLEVTKKVMPIAEAKKSGAVSMFGEKYGENVRVVSAGDFSSEFCGGCHVNRTGDIGLFKITSDRSLAAGVRRMEALTGRGAVEYVQNLSDTAREIEQSLNIPLKDAAALIKSMQEKQKLVERELKALKLKVASGGGASSSNDDGIVEIDGVRLIARRVDDISGGDLRNLADELRHKVKSGIVLIGSASDGKATLLAAVTADVVSRVSASSIIQKLAPMIGGKGGGKPDLAQAGGKDADKLDEVIRIAPETVREMLSA
jgi:alanyl-tRNA synthetase